VVTAAGTAGVALLIPYEPIQTIQGYRCNILRSSGSKSLANGGNKSATVTLVTLVTLVLSRHMLTFCAAVTTG